MRNIFLVLFCVIVFSLKAQENKKNIANKTFIATVGSICEEVTPPSDCAGAMVYLVLKFDKNKVLITEKEISSCDKETIHYKVNYKWELINNTVKIYKDLEEIRFTYLENLLLILKEGKILGTRKIYDGRKVEYKFKQIKD